LNRQELRGQPGCPVPGQRGPGGVECRPWDFAARDPFLDGENHRGRRGKVADARDTGHQHLLGGNRHRDCLEL
jgi:hypothetical protein